MATRDNKDSLMRLHLCCGDIYLKDYINIDVTGRKPTKCNHRATTIEQYYRGKSVNHSKKPVVDIAGSISDLDFPKGSIDEIVMISAFEHFTEQEALQLVKSFYRMLKKGGQFKFDFPDIKKTALEYDDHYMIRLVYGSYKNEYARHKWGYTKNTIKRLFDKWHSLDFKDIVAHDYPMIGVISTK